MASQETNGNKNAAQWKRCRPGRFEGLASSLRSRQSRRTFLKSSIAGGVAALAAVGVGIWLWNRADDGSIREPNYGGITCSETRRYLMSNEQLSREIIERVRDHLSQCEPCRRQFRDRMDRLS